MARSARLPQAGTTTPGSPCAPDLVGVAAYSFACSRYARRAADVRRPAVGVGHAAAGAADAVAQRLSAGTAAVVAAAVRGAHITAAAAVSHIMSAIPPIPGACMPGHGSWRFQPCVQTSAPHYLMAGCMGQRQHVLAQGERALSCKMIDIHEAACCGRSRLHPNMAVSKFEMRHVR